MIVLGPVVNYWYFLWLIFFIPFLDTKARRLALFTMACMPLSYTFWQNKGTQSFLPYWDIEHLLIFLAGFWIYIARGLLAKRTKASIGE